MTIAKSKKDTTKNLVKISPNMGSLHPEFIRTKYRKESGYLSKLDKLNKIESNFNIDQYMDPKY